MFEFNKRGNISEAIRNAQASMSTITQLQKEEVPDTITIIRGGDNPSRETLAWDGEKMTTEGGLEQQHFESKEMQSKYYVTHNMMSLQKEYEETSEALKQAHPDGTNYVKGTQEILSQRLKDIQANAPDEASRFEVTMQGERFLKDAMKAAINDENKLIRNAFGNNFEETKRDILNNVRKNPESVEAAQLEMSDHVLTAGNILGWTAEKTYSEMEKQHKALAIEGIWGRADKEGAAKVTKDLTDGRYGKLLTSDETKSLMKSIRKNGSLKQEIKQAPTIDELRSRGQTHIATGKSLDDLKNEGVERPELFVTAQLSAAEQQRESVPIYKHNKELLQGNEPEWLPEGVKSYRLSRLQQLNDAGTLNEQSVALIDKETKEKLQVQATKLIPQSTYLKGWTLPKMKASLDKGNEDPLEAAREKLRSDWHSGKLTEDEVTKQFNILQGVGRVLSWQ